MSFLVRADSFAMQSIGETVSSVSTASVKSQSSNRKRRYEASSVVDADEVMTVAAASEAEEDIDTVQLIEEKEVEEEEDETPTYSASKWLRLSSWQRRRLYAKETAATKKQKLVEQKATAVFGDVWTEEEDDEDEETETECD